MAPGHAYFRAPYAPPALRYEYRYAQPSLHHMWINGYWGWRNGYTWFPGYWAIPPYAGLFWIPAHWVFSEGAWLLIDGYWSNQQVQNGYYPPPAPQANVQVVPQQGYAPAPQQQGYAPAPQQQGYAPAPTTAEPGGAPPPAAPEYPPVAEPAPAP